MNLFVCYWSIPGNLYQYKGVVWEGEKDQSHFNVVSNEIQPDYRYNLFELLGKGYEIIQKNQILQQKL